MLQDAIDGVQKKVDAQSKRQKEELALTLNLTQQEHDRCCIVAALAVFREYLTKEEYSLVHDSLGKTAEDFNKKSIVLKVAMNIAFASLQE